MASRHLKLLRRLKCLKERESTINHLHVLENEYAPSPNSGKTEVGVKL